MNTEEILDICVSNSYDILTGRKTIDQILISKSPACFLWNMIEEDLTEEDLDECIDFMIEYYEGLEKYERCSVLLDMKVNERSRC
tara:strand:+ start:1161 stop:1415 length:255 start_codon:yes stop_codon:yes gene_type:complete